MNEVLKNNVELAEDMKDNEEFVEEVEESKFKGFINKAGAGIKKHGKKVAGVAALVAIGAIGYALGHKTGDHDDSDYIYGGDDSETIDIPESNIVDDVTEE